MSAARTEPVARTGMLVRRPIDDVWQALTDPGVTARFWYSDGEGHLDRAGARARWHWRWYGFHVEAVALEAEPPHRLVYDWGVPGEAATRVEYRLKPVAGGTFVEIDSWNFAGTEAERAKAAIDSAGGFSFVLAGLKAFLEHGIELGLVPDRFPREGGQA